jgi:hypothetical protein
MAVPVAALQFVNPTIASAEESGRFVAASPKAADAAVAGVAGTSASAVTNSVATTVTNDMLTFDSEDHKSIVKPNGEILIESPTGATIRVFPADAKGRRRTIMTGPSGNVMEFADARAVPGLTVRPPQPPRPPRTVIERAIERRALGVTAEYAAAIRSAAPGLDIDDDEIVEMKAVGVSPEYLRDLASSGYRGLDTDEIVQARALHIDGAYIRGMSDAGYRHLTIDQLVELKAVGVTPADVVRLRRSGHGLPSVDDIVEMKAVGVEPEDLDSR